MPGYLRHLIFTLFALLFMISAPLVVFYTAGYRYDLQHRSVVQTGVLNLRSTPRDAVVSIDGQPHSDRTPSVIDDLLPGMRDITVSREGYTPWTQTVRIYDSSTTYVSDVVLFLQSAFLFEPISSTERVVSHPFLPKHVAITTQDGFTQLLLFEEDQTNPSLLQRMSLEVAETIELSWSSDGIYLLVKPDNVDPLPANDPLVLNTLTGEAVPLDPAIPSSASAVWWDVGRSAQLVIQTPEETHLYDLSEQTHRTIDVRLHAARTVGDGLLGTQSVQGRQVIAYFESDGTANIQTYAPDTPTRFIHAPGDLIVLHQPERGVLLFLQLQGNESRQLTIDAERWAWNTQTSELLVTDGFEVQRVRMNPLSAETVLRVSRPIEQVGWYPIGQIMLYHQDSALRALDLSASDPANKTELFSGAHVAGFWTSDDGKDLFILGIGEEGEGLYTRPLQE